MNLTVALRARLSGRSDSEHEQAILRITIFALVLAYMAAVYSPGDGATGLKHRELLLFQGLAAAMLLAVMLFLAICSWPAPNVPRRVIGMLVDAGAATFCMFMTGESGVLMVGVYLFITSAMDSAMGAAIFSLA